MSRHGNISIFVPHIGCPHRCSFCDQRAITGKNKAPTPADVDRAVEQAIGGMRYDPKTTELAFFGGSFTAIPRKYMLSLLQAGHRWVQQGKVSGIRLSTRPDAVPPEILLLLQQYGVTAIELGCQSFVDAVLEKNHRGHTSEEIIMAAKRIRQAGFSLGMQMMTGLFGDTEEGALYTAQKIIECQPDTVRIYPTVVLTDTELHRRFLAGEYKPQTLEEAVSLTARLLPLFESAGIRVIRVGLHTLEADRLVAGPWHPAFGELCQSKILLERIVTQLKQNHIPRGEILITVPIGKGSAMIGHNKTNIEILKKMGYNSKITESLVTDIYVRSKHRAD